MFSQTPSGWISVKPRSVNMEPLIEVRKTALPEAQRRRQRPWCGKAGWWRSDQDSDTHHSLPMRCGISMLQVERVHPEPIE